MKGPEAILHLLEGRTIKSGTAKYCIRKVDENLICFVELYQYVGPVISSIMSLDLNADYELCLEE